MLVTELDKVTEHSLCTILKTLHDYTSILDLQQDISLTRFV